MNAAPHTQAAPVAFPRGPLLAVGALLLCVLLAVTAVRLSGMGAVRVPDAAASQVGSFRFVDASDGAVQVIDATTGRALSRIEPGTNGFLRSTLRGLARERRRQALGADAPFELIGRADGRLTLLDPATGRRVDLESFGPANARVFAQLLQAQAAR